MVYLCKNKSIHIVLGVTRVLNMNDENNKIIQKEASNVSNRTLLLSPILLTSASVFVTQLALAEDACNTNNNCLLR